MARFNWPLKWLLISSIIIREISSCEIPCMSVSSRTWENGPCPMSCMRIAACTASASVSKIKMPFCCSEPIPSRYWTDWSSVPSDSPKNLIFCIGWAGRWAIASFNNIGRTHIACALSLDSETEQGRKHHFTTGVGEVGVNNDNYVYEKTIRRKQKSQAVRVVPRYQNSA